MAAPTATLAGSQGNAAAATTCVVVLSAAIGLGETAYIFIANAGGLAVSGVTDSGGNSWAVVGAGGSGAASYTVWKINGPTSKALAVSDTITVTATSQRLAAIVVKFSDPRTVSDLGFQFPATAAQTGTSIVVPSVALSATPARAALADTVCLAVCVAILGTAADFSSVDSGYTILASVASSVASFSAISVATKTVVATVPAQHPTFTLGTSRQACGGLCFAQLPALLGSNADTGTRPRTSAAYTPTPGGSTHVDYGPVAQALPKWDRAPLVQRRIQSADSDPLFSAV